ncbi:MAG TPA: ABC transporter permease [Bryobacteraceae bacterium]|nr:ABC transporter permease [Bryobacteraceae bacterium]
MTLFSTLGSSVEKMGEVGVFTGRVLRASIKRPFEWQEIVQQIHEVGVRSLPLIAASGVALGVVMSFHTRSSMVRFGAESMIPAVLAIAIFREIGPLVAGLLLAGRVGAGIGAQIAGMRVTEQIDALEALAIDSFKYLVVTRVLACIIALPVLTTVIDFAGLIGGFLSENAISDTSFRYFFNRAFASLDWTDYIQPTLKTTAFGLIIGSISSYLGYTATQGATGVGRASTGSVVYSSLVLILTNILLVKFTEFWFPQ